jgi:hypothetical protein
MMLSSPAGKLETLVIAKLFAAAVVVAIFVDS